MRSFIVSDKIGGKGDYEGSLEASTRYLWFVFVWSGKFNFYHGTVREFRRVISVATKAFRMCLYLR